MYQLPKKTLRPEKQATAKTRPDVYLSHYLPSTPQYPFLSYQSLVLRANPSRQDPRTAQPHPRRQALVEPGREYGGVQVVWRAVFRRPEALPTAAAQGGQTRERLGASTETYSCGGPSTPG